MSRPTLGSSSSSSLGGVQQRGRHLAAHPLAQRQLPHRSVQKGLHGQQRDAPVQPFPPTRRREPVDRREQPEGLGQRQVPPQLAALAEHDADAAGQLAALADRLEPGDSHEAGGGHQYPGEHLDGRRLAGPVRADVADALAARHGEADAVDGPHHPALPPQPPDRPADHELAPQVPQLDEALAVPRDGRSTHPPAPT